jgi:hypothetical protein
MSGTNLKWKPDNWNTLSKLKMKNKNIGEKCQGPKRNGSLIGLKPRIRPKKK